MSDTKPEIGVIAFFACLIAVTGFVAFLAAMVIANSGLDPVMLSIIFYGWVVGIFIAMVTAMPIGCLIGWLFHKAGMLTGLTSGITGMLTGFILALAVVFGDWSVATALAVSAFALLGFISEWAAYRLVGGRSTMPAET